jgi:lysozyme family protein
MAYPNLFKKILYVVLQNEGGYSNHPADPGHATNKGITQAVYDQYRIKNLQVVQSVIHITDEEVEDIYWTMYWIPSRVAQLPDEDLMLHVFDHGVNAGVFTSVRMLQRLVGEVDDGNIGPKTIKAVREFNGDVVEEFIKRRKLFYVTLAQNKPDLRVFLKGWLARVDKTRF